ncbi:Chloride channel protein EriC [Marinobacterium lacunae]|uniref:Chloride channel protein EriC n=1 Tax=Marinobacterium lacunae TaxID=1232683 RepID=A0A081G279_9GAMM|nr:chloride channel protein [Marinobacterium lacunae]KEA64884.1 Chloride channel protein EriC [Marinobacterium lacunae]MBR9885681.1 chloride channel protein [Oceanospirillales bacterium]
MPSLEQFRQRLSHFDALPQLVLLGVLAGFSTGLVILLFRLAIELPQFWLLPSGISEDFESLAPWQRFCFPVIGSIILVALLILVPRVSRSVGIPHLLERLNYHQGQLSISNLLTQFAGATIAIGSGHSVGREGPAVYLGGSCGSLIGQWLNLPNNTLRILIGCGSAAAIAAVFNTPLAGVIFAMEVILLEYSILGFIPVIVAAVVADVLVQLVIGHAAKLHLPELSSDILPELPLLLILGLGIGLVAAAFIYTLQQTLKLRGTPLPVRFIMAGLLTGMVAMAVPEVMGTGYDSIQRLFDAPAALELLLLLLVCKTVLTPFVIGLGLPGGIIGPSLVIGALSGALLAGFAQKLGFNMPVDLFTTIGMGAMMGAILNAPLAALIALLELTDNSAIILPGMIAIVVSNLTLRSLFKRPSAFQATLEARGLDIRQAPLAQALSRAAVGSLLERDIISTPAVITSEHADRLLQTAPRWFLVEQDEARALLPMGDLTRWLEKHPTEDGKPEIEIELLHIPASRQEAIPIYSRATLHEAWETMTAHGVTVLLVISNQGVPLGVIRRSKIEEYYNHKQAL